MSQHEQKQEQYEKAAQAVVEALKPRNVSIKEKEANHEEPTASGSKSSLIDMLHLDKQYSLLTVRNVCILQRFYQLIDVHKTNSWNELQFDTFARLHTTFKRKQIKEIFEMFDLDCSGGIEFQEFVIFFSILIARNDGEETQFIYRHSRTVFDLLDTDASNSITVKEFRMFGLLFNFSEKAMKKIFNEFDISGDKELNYKEFKMFAMACIQKQRDIDREKSEKERQRNKRSTLANWSLLRKPINEKKDKE